MIERKTTKEIMSYCENECFCSYCREKYKEIDDLYNVVWLRESDLKDILNATTTGNIEFKKGFDCAINYVQNSLCNSQEPSEKKQKGDEIK